MPKGYGRVLAYASADGPSRSAFTTAITLLPEHARCPMPAEEWFVGRCLRITASGRVSNVLTSQPTFTFSFRMGATSTQTVFSTGAILTSTSIHTTVPWWMQIDLNLRTQGASTAGTLFGQGIIHSRAFLDAGATADITTLGHPSLLIPETTPAVGTGFDTTVLNVADLFVACSVSDAGNLIQLHQYTLEDLN